MDHRQLLQLLHSVKSGASSIEDAAAALQRLPSEPLADACVDHHRTLRTGIPEVIFGESKTVEQISAIAAAILASGAVMLATRIDSLKAQRLLSMLPGLVYHDKARLLTGMNRQSLR